jgi:two-component system response regulator HydG
MPKNEQEINPRKPFVLIVDDEPSITDSLQLAFGDKYNLTTVNNGFDALTEAKKQHFDLVLLDVMLPEMSGIDALLHLKDIDPEIEVIMVTAVVDISTAVKAMKRGAFDYLTKPIDIDVVEAQVTKVLEKKALEKENQQLKSALGEDFQFEKIIGRSPEIKKIFSVIQDVSQSSATVLITGESGTGKELVAKAIHNQSDRKNKLFVAVNCAAIPDNLLESQLFGHEKGSFTGAFERHLGKFEVADGGTLFLDEITSLPMPMQAKLLRAIQEREVERVGSSRPIPVNVRIIAASNVELKDAVADGKFREDLYFRLSVIPVHVPALREHKEDIPLLVSHFLNIFNQQLSRKVKNFSPSAMNAMMEYQWPGNVRELENLIERLVVLSKSPTVGKEMLPTEIAKIGTPEKPMASGKRSDRVETLSYKDALRKFEASFIKKAVDAAGGNKSEAARRMGIHRNTLINKSKDEEPRAND